MHTLANIVEENFKHKVFTSVVFLDVSGAFDSTWTPAILAATAEYNCPKYLMGVIKSLFENREANINVNDFIFKYIVSIGCPQGGIISPFLWKIVAEKLINSNFPFKFLIIGYADDIALVAMHKILQISIANLQTMCNEVFKNCENVLLDINPLKSVLMIFCKKMITDAVQIKINNVNIFPSRSTKFVGFEVDTKLNWRTHVEEKCLATQRVIHNLKYCLRRTWGLNTNTLLTLFKSIIVPKLLYGVSVWSHCLKKKWCINKLRNTQYQMLKCITRSHKTAHRESLLIISNLLPIDLIAFEFAALRFLLYKNRPFSIFSAKAIGLTLSESEMNNISSVEVSRNFRSSTKQPWEIPPLTYSNATAAGIRMLAAKPNSAVIFVATAPHEKGILARSALCSPTVRETQEVLFPSFISSTQAEIGAIHLAIQNAAANSSHFATCNIVSCSKPALNRTLTFKKISPTASESREMILANGDLFSFHWLSSNDFLELSDINSVKSTPTSLAITNTEVWLSTLRKKISNKIQKLWKKEWSENTNKGAITRSFFPSPADAYLLKGVYISHQITQLLTGHCQLNRHLFKIKKIQSPVCDCGTEEESIEHFLFTCCLFTAQRKTFKEACLEKIRDYPPPLTTVATSSAIWKALLNFIKETRRLDHKREE
jgi:hypothetical protein